MTRTSAEDVIDIIRNDRPPLETVRTYIESQTHFTERDRLEIENAIQELYSEFSSDEEDSFGQIVEEVELSGFIKDWIVHTRGCRAPTSLHFAAALTAVSATLKRNVMTFMDEGFLDVTPPTHFLYVAPSGIGKSKWADYCLKEAKPLPVGKDTVGDFWSHLADNATIQALWDKLYDSTDSCGLLYVSELTTLMKKDDRNAEHLPTDLGRLFDNPASFTRHTVSGGEKIINFPGVPALMCTTPVHLGSNLDNKAFGGGFLSRLIVFNDAARRPKSYQSEFPLDREWGREIMTQLVALRGVSGQIPITPEADELFGSIESEYEIRRAGEGDPNIQYAYNRFPQHISRMALCIAMSDYAQDSIGNEARIEERHIYQAWKLFDWTVDRLPLTYYRIGSSTFGEWQARIYEFIKQGGGVANEATIFKRCARDLSHKAFQEHIQALVAKRIVERVASHALQGGNSWKIVGEFYA